jgi:hypothetical protein
MRRPQRFPFKLEFWTTPEQLAGIELLCSDGLTDKAGHLRQALAMYLRHFGIKPAPRPAPAINGAAHHHQVPAT